MKADAICRMNLSVLMHILQREGIITDEDLEDINKGVFRFPDREK